MEDYLVPRGVGQAEYIEKKSRFLGGVYPVTSEQEAKEILERVRKQHYDARHNCWCYILKSGQKRYSDDAEPQGTAGQPMLNVFEREGVVDVLCIVTRYFGGILLALAGFAERIKGGEGRAGRGGNFRGKCSRGSGSKLPFPTRFLSGQSFDRGAAQEGTVEDAQYGADILMTYRIPEGADERLRTALREASSGSVKIVASWKRFSAPVKQNIQKIQSFDIFPCYRIRRSESATIQANDSNSRNTCSSRRTRRRRRRRRAGSIRRRKTRCAHATSGTPTGSSTASPSGGSCTRRRSFSHPRETTTARA